MKFPKEKLFFWLRLIVSLVLIVFIISRVEADRFVDLLLSIRLPFFLLALLLVTLERILLAYKWNVLLAAKRVNIPLLKIVKIYYLSNFVGMFLPSSIGVDVLRGYSLYKYSSNSSESISSVFVDKIIALLSSLIVVLVNIMLFSHMIANPYILPTILVMTAFFILFLIVILNRQVAQFVINSLNWINLQHLKIKVQRLYNTFSEYMIHKHTLFYALVLSLLFQVIRVFGVYSVSLSLNQDIGIIYFFIFVPIIIVLATIPISLGGIGIREGAFVYFFSQVGMSLSDAFTLSILIYVLTMISIIPGGIIYVLEGLFIKDRNGMKQEKIEV